MAANISKSIPAQKALPAPVTITTREWLFSMASSALCNSAIICVLMALRLSGRFSVILAISPLNSRIKVEYMAEASLIQKWHVRIFRADFVGHGQNLLQARDVDAGIGARFAQRRQHLFGGDVPNQIVSRKGAAAKSRQRAVKSPASGFIGSKNFLLRVLRPAVQMYAQLEPRDVVLYLAKEIADQLWGCRAHRVRERNGAHAGVLQPLERVLHNLRPPGLIIRVAEGHGDVNDQVAMRGGCSLLQRLDEGPRFLARHIGVGPSKIRRDGIGVPDRRDAVSCERPFESLFVDDDADDFRSLVAIGKGSAEYRHNFFAIRHLFHMLWRNKAHRIDMFESSDDELFDVLGFRFRRNKIRYPLPRIPRTLN